MDMNADRFVVLIFRSVFFSSSADRYFSDLNIGIIVVADGDGVVVSFFRLCSFVKYQHETKLQIERYNYLNAINFDK